MNIYPGIISELSNTLRGNGLLPNDLETWNNLIKKYPSFDLMQILYLKKIKEEEPVNLAKEIKKSSIYFSNLLWMDYLLNMNDQSTMQEKAETPIENASHDKMSKMLEAQALSFQKPVDENAALPITIEALHRIDYFESQGIRLEEQPEKQDQLEKRVKKFTDWLKEMKRINPHPFDLGSQEASSEQVEGLAAISNETKEEVLTEAMAEVLIKQGKKNEAIRVYEKLSFLNPSKSTYFAAKIENLKQH